jgi:hypothetical protein
VLISWHEHSRFIRRDDEQPAFFLLAWLNSSRRRMASRTYTVHSVGERAVWQRFLLCRLVSGTVPDTREDDAWERLVDRRSGESCPV